MVEDPIAPTNSAISIQHRNPPAKSSRPFIPAISQRGSLLFQHPNQRLRNTGGEARLSPPNSSPHREFGRELTFHEGVSPACFLRPTFRSGRLT